VVPENSLELISSLPYKLKCMHIGYDEEQISIFPGKKSWKGKRNMGEKWEIFECPTL
jgi:hypothetical protein